jgi:hypothetical protein
MSKTQKKKQAQAAAALNQNQSLSDDAMPQMPILPDPRSPSISSLFSAPTNLLFFSLLESNIYGLVTLVKKSISK